MHVYQGSALPPFCKEAQTVMQDSSIQAIDYTSHIQAGPFRDMHREGCCGMCLRIILPP